MTGVCAWWRYKGLGWLHHVCRSLPLPPVSNIQILSAYQFSPSHSAHLFSFTEIVKVFVAQDGFPLCNNHMTWFIKLINRDEYHSKFNFNIQNIYESQKIWPLF